MSSFRIWIITACWHELHTNLNSWIITDLFLIQDFFFPPSQPYDSVGATWKPILPSRLAESGRLDINCTEAEWDLKISTDRTQPLSRKPITIQPDGSNMRKAGHQLYRGGVRHQNLQPDVPPIWWKKIDCAADWGRDSWSLGCALSTFWHWWFLGSRS